MCLVHLSSEYSQQCNEGQDDLIFFFFFKSARNAFNKEEVNYDNYSEWLDPWALLISIYCLDYRTIQVKPNCGCSFTLKTWKGNGGRSLQQPPPWCRRRQSTSPQPADSLLVETHPYGPQHFRPIHLCVCVCVCVCVCFIFAWAMRFRRLITGKIFCPSYYLRTMLSGGRT